MDSRRIFCPACHARLKAKVMPAIGTHVRCPKCSVLFTISESTLVQSASDALPPGGPRTAPVKPRRPPPLPDRPGAPLAPIELAEIPSEPLPAAGSGAMPSWLWGMIGAGGAVVACLVIWAGLSMIGGGGSDKSVAQNAPTVAQTPAASADRVASSSPVVSQGQSPPASSPAWLQENVPSTASSEKPAISARRPAELAYALKPDLNYVYQFELTTGADGNGDLKSSGRVTYILDSASPPHAPAAAASAKTQTASGTAFVINSAGWLVTCAHVIDDASTIEVTLVGKKYTAEVIESDAVNDVALLKIEAVGLRVLPVAAAQPQQGDEVNVAGFPLSDMLGDSLKITHGRVAGFVHERDQHLIQIDAAVNPGNSGGPLVNAAGQVVGVVNAGLFGARISAVGLAMRLEPLRSLLHAFGGRGQTVSWETAMPTDPLSGPELAAKVRDCVARVEVQIDTSKPFQNARRVRFFGSQTGLSEPVKTTSGALVVLPRGEVTMFEGGPPVCIPFEPLPRAGQQHWTATHRGSTQPQTSGSDFPFPGPGFAGRGFAGRGFAGRGFAAGGFGPPTGPGSAFRSAAPASSSARISSEDHLTYDVQELADERAVIATKLNSQLTSDPDGKSVGSMSGQGQYTFDRTRGAISESRMEIRFEANVKGAEVSIPMNFSYKLVEVLSRQEIQDRTEKQRRDAEEMAEKNRQDQAEREAKRKVEDEAKLSAAIAALKTGQPNSVEVRKALFALSSLRPEEASSSREEVAKLLNRFLQSNDDFLRHTALNAAGSWAGEANIPVLLQLVQRSDAYQVSVLKALGTTGGSEKAAEVVARLLETDSRPWAAQALMGMKTFAEPAVLPLLQSKDHWVRDSACEILGEVGGQKSREALEAALAKSTDTDFGNWAAKDALEKIKKRLATTKD